jgi:hypothetical protein
MSESATFIGTKGKSFRMWKTRLPEATADDPEAKLERENAQLKKAARLRHRQTPLSPRGAKLLRERGR